MSKIPKGLPQVDHTVSTSNQSVFEKSRVCPYCDSGKGVRIVSNSSGVHAFCGPCKRHWPISSTPMASEVPLSAPRGIHKETLVEPDWDKAYDEVGEDVTNEQVGPKKR